MDSAKSLSSELRFFEPGNAGKLAAAIENSYRDRARRAELALNARRERNRSVRQRNEFMTRYSLETIGSGRVIPNIELLHKLADPPLFDSVLESNSLPSANSR